MSEFLLKLFDTADFPSRWTCGNWTTAHGALHIGSDVATWGAYMAIPLALAYFIVRRKDMPFPRVFWLFAAFIFACGSVHLVEAAIFWWPVYRLSGLLKLATGLVSWATVLALIPTIPKVLELRSPEVLQREIDERKRTEQQLERANRALKEEIRRRERTDDQLARERDLLRTLIDNTPDYIFAKDTEGRFTVANEVLRQAMGAASSDEVVGKTDYDLSPRDLADRYHRDDRRVLTTGKPLVNREEKTRDSAGNERWILTTKVPLRDASGSIAGLVGISRDITSRKEAQTRLKQAKNAAEAANRAKSEFVANMSHEIRTPLNGIIGMAELALDTDLDGELRDYLETIDQSADSLLMIVNDVLDFSKIESGKFELDSMDFRLRDTMDDTLETLANQAHEKGIELVCHVAPDAPDHLVGDPVRLRQIVTNLVANAIKFTKEGEVALHVKVDSLRDENVGLRFCVADTGIGISADKQQMIFEAFSQADASTTRQYGGTGLGLTIASELVRQMEGEIEVRSEPGQGSEFSFTVHLVIQDEGHETVSATPAALNGVPVLIVDDNATNQRILHEMLSGWGMRPTVAATGAEALRAIETGVPYRLILTDFHMPGMDGFALAERIRGKDRNVPVILLTSALQTGHRERAAELHIDTLLSKPVRRSKLLEAILACIGVRSPDAPSRSATPPSKLRPLRVLLAEDGIVNQKLAVGMLKKQGHSVVVAHDGQEAVSAMEDHDFDLILMDVQMPVIDGFEATRRIRQREQQTGRRIPIVAMTAHAMKGDREKCLDAGMDEYMSKPIRTKRLYETIARLIGFEIVDVQRSAAPRREQPSLAEDGVIDVAHASGAVGGDVALLKEVGQTFLQECPTLVDAIGRAIEQSDAELLHRSAHTLKSSLRLFGARAAMRVALELETMGRDGDFSNAASRISALKIQLEKVISAVENAVSKL